MLFAQMAFGACIISETGVTDISEIHGNVSQSIKDRVMKIRQDILDGEIKVPFIPKPRPN